MDFIKIGDTRVRKSSIVGYEKNPIWVEEDNVGRDCVITVYVLRSDELNNIDVCGLTEDEANAELTRLDKILGIE